MTFVGQAPSIIMQGAIVPSMGALIANGLMKHSEVAVRVSVASCLCEVARITAPEPPYKDEIMKVFQELNFFKQKIKLVMVIIKWFVTPFYYRISSSLI